jgi:hypothetical protein
MAESVEAVVRALRPVIGGLIGGLLSFTMVAFIAGPLSPSFDPDLAGWMLVAIVFLGAGSATGYFMLRRSLIRRLATRAAELRQQSDASALIGTDYRGFAVAGAGLIEAPGLFAALTFLLTGNRLALAAVAVVVALLVAHLPSAEKMRRLVDEATQ